MIQASKFPSYHVTVTLVVDLYLTSQMFSGFNLQILGKLNRARDQLKKELEEAQILDQPYTWDMSLNGQSFIYEMFRDPAMTERLSLELKRNSEEHNITYGLVLSMFHLGWVISCRGQLEEGITQMQQGLKGFKNAGAYSFVPLFSALLIDALIRADKFKQGLEV